MKTTLFFFGILLVLSSCLKSHVCPSYSKSMHVRDDYARHTNKKLKTYKYNRYTGASLKNYK